MWKIIMGFSVVGVLLAIYLLFEQANPATSFQPCNINSIVNCNAIISGSVSKTFGIPTPVIGLLGYVIIFFAARTRKRKLLLGMAGFGLLFCLWIAYQELLLLHVICPVCILCQLDMITVFVLALMLQKGEIKNEK